MENTTAGQVATELRRLADALDKEPELAISRPSVYISYRYGGDTAKDMFIGIARILPRPLAKIYKDDELQLKYESPALNVQAYIERNKVCEIVEPARPAVYHCVPLLSDEEMEEAVKSF